MNLAGTVRTREEREELGQFLTAPPVADFMASMFAPFPKRVRLLDAGAGAGALTAAVVKRICKRGDGVRSIDATLYEIDSSILETLWETMRGCERTCEAEGIPKTQNEMLHVG